MADKMRVVVFQDNDAWVAQALEYDIGAQAPALEELLDRFEVAVECERQTSKEFHGAEFAGIPQAPDYFFRMWERRSGFLQPADGDTSETKKDYELAMCA